MNRRNFVVGLGTVATISGVASVTAATFSSEVQATTNFQIVPEDTELTVRRLEDNISSYNDLHTGNASWNESPITDFANVTGNQNSPVVAYVNESTDGQLGAQLAFNNTNSTQGSSGADTYLDYTVDSSNGNYGFFEVANLGETDENVSITLGYNSGNVGTDPASTDGIAATEAQVADMFTFQDENGNAISPSSTDPATPVAETTVPSGEIETIGLEISIEDDVYENVQDEAGGAFGSGASSIQLLDTVTVGTDNSDI